MCSMIKYFILRFSVQVHGIPFKRMIVCFLDNSNNCPHYLVLCTMLMAGDKASVIDSTIGVFTAL